jgi:hypothetical protein
LSPPPATLLVQQQPRQRGVVIHGRLPARAAG